MCGTAILLYSVDCLLLTLVDTQVSKFTCRQYNLYFMINVEIIKINALIECLH